jgi:hypothetical protein
LEQNALDGVALKQMFIMGARMLEKNKSAIDALNVFPVPDGDTGTNMSLTMASAIKEVLKCEATSVAEVADVIAKGALRGARGNSGVILSQIFKGLAKGLAGLDTATAQEFAQQIAYIGQAVTDASGAYAFEYIISDGNYGDEYAAVIGGNNISGHATAKYKYFDNTFLKGVIDAINKFDVR